MTVLTRLDPPAAGLGACDRCPYLHTGAPATCYPCATEPAGAPAAPAAARCDACTQALGVDGACPNAVCGLPDRWFSRVHTVSERSEDMWQAVYRYKYGGERQGADVLGRVLVGYLEAHREELSRYDLIAPCALYIGPRATRLWDYLEPVLAAAAASGWPVAPGLIRKSGPTDRFLGIGVAERRLIAEGPLRAVLSVPEPERVAGRRVLVFDDVYSEGYSLREMARVLRLAGATEVAGLVLARRKGA